MGQYEKKNIGDARMAIFTIIGALLICLCITLLSGCKTRYITQEVPVIVHDKDSIVKVQQIHTHDTLRQRDSVVTIMLGDTILIEKWHNTQIINHINRIDTLVQTQYIEKPITVTKTEIKEVNKLHWWQSAFAWVGGVVLAVGAGIGGWKLWRLIRPI